MKWNEVAWGKFRLKIRKRFFTKRVKWSSPEVTREVVTAPSPSEFKDCLDDVLHLDLGSLTKSKELDSMIIMGPFQLKIVYDSTIL